MNNTEELIPILIGTIGFIFFIIIGLVVFQLTRKSHTETKNISKEEVKSTDSKTKTYSVESVFSFMEFDKVEDNMILQKNGNKFVMVLECQGVNYDLMSQVEKGSVEEGFIQFLNSIRYPIQIYTQTRTINLESSITTYREKVSEIDEKLAREEIKYREMVNSTQYTQEQKDKAQFELTKQRNLAEYGKDIIFNTEKMSLNKNVLNKKYYIIVPYTSDELGQNDFDKEEIRGMAFSELYTRGQAILGTLSVCGIVGKILNSNELVDLLYVAYNRDESEAFGLDKAIKAGYQELYSTAPDVLDKKIKELDFEIEKEAYAKASQKVTEVKSEKQLQVENKQQNMESLIDKMAKSLLQQNASVIGEDIAQKAIKKLEDENNKKSKTVKKTTKSTTKKEDDGGTKDNGKKRKTNKSA